jgi:Protein of unknown function (DUF2752)
MKVIWQNPASRRPNTLEAYCVLLLMAGGAYLYYASNAGLASPVHEGFVGPFRGGTRALASLIAGRWNDALYYNPLAVVFCAALAAGTLRWLCALTLARRPIVELSTRGRVMVLALAMLIFLAGWAYVLIGQSFTRPYSA